MIKVNGKALETSSATLSELVSFLKFNNENIAIVKNGRIIRKQDWNNEPVNDGDSIEIFSPVSGG
jgi:thiamine biosynthesis protein ThiS